MQMQLSQVELLKLTVGSKDELSNHIMSWFNGIMMAH